MQCRAAYALASLIAAGCKGWGSSGGTADAAATGADAPVMVLDTSAADASGPSDLPLPGDGAADGGAVSGACSAPAPAPLRRLSNTQYQRTVRELTGVTVATALPPETGVDGFEDRAVVQQVDVLRVAAWERAADEIVAALQPRLADLVGCPAGTIDEACARAFITSFGARAFRRPLTTVEIDGHVRLFTQVSAMGDASDGIGAVLRAFLQSPHFLYRPEIGGTASGARLPPSSWEVASRLSYFLWGNMPDAPLFAAAQAGELATPQQVAVQARRMMLDQRARQGANDFFRQWLGLNDVMSVTKDRPEWNQGLSAAMREEGFRFTQRVVFDGDGRFASLFNSEDAVVNGPLAQLYGLSITGTDWQEVKLTGKPRLGLLTQGWFLASRARGADSSPVTRGLFVRWRLFCQAIPAPPPNEPPVGPAPPSGSTTRERHAVHQSDPACAGCHQLMDPLGFPFEHYDGLGAFRPTENGKPIDSSGEISGTDVDGPVTDALSLSRRLATSAEAGRCMTQRWYELATGRDKTEVDECRTSELDRLFKASNGHLRQLMIDIATTSALAPRPAADVNPAGMGGQPLLVNPGQARKMVLDLLFTQVSQLKARLAPPEDRMRLDQHLEGLRDLERQAP
jgi:hypothetical protein